MTPHLEAVEARRVCCVCECKLPNANHLTMNVCGCGCLIALNERLGRLGMRAEFTEERQ